MLSYFSACCTLPGARCFFRTFCITRVQPNRFHFLTERHKCSIPSSGRRREEKGSVVFLSLFLSLTADHQAADQVRKPEWKSASARQAPPPSGSLSLTDFSLSRWGKKREGERKKKNHKLPMKTSACRPGLERAP